MAASCWVERRPDGCIDGEVWPAEKPGEEHAPGRPWLVNDVGLARDWSALPLPRSTAIDLRDLIALTDPLAAHDSVEDWLAARSDPSVAATGARALHGTTSRFEAAFRAWPEELATWVATLLGESTAPAWIALGRLIAEQTCLTLQPERPDHAATAFLNLVQSGGERPLKREPVDPAEYRPIDAGAVVDGLGPKGIFADVLEGYEPREGQQAMARAVAESFNANRHLVVEAGTGVGKSVAYLLPAIRWAQTNRVPVVVSTHTKNLQTQLFAKDIPLLRKVLDTPFRAALIKGRSNYVCLRRLRHLLERRGEDLEPGESPALAMVLAWLTVTTSGDLDELDRVAARGAAALIGQLPSSGEECPGRRCAFHGRCFLQQARIRSQNADVVVANHALVFADAKGQPVALPRHAHVVFDEAHNLEEAATRFFSVEFSPVRVRLLMRRIRSRGRRSGGLLATLRDALGTLRGPSADSPLTPCLEAIEEALQQADEVWRTARELWLALARVPRPGEAPLRYHAADWSRERWAPAVERRDALHEALEGLAEGLDAIGRDPVLHADEGCAPPVAEDLVRELDATLLAVRELLDGLDTLSRADNPEFVYWLDFDRRGREPLGQLHAAPIDISQRLADGVFSTMQSAVLCSATLSVNGSFLFLEQRIGLNRLDPDRVMRCQAASPFDYAAQCRAAALSFLPDPTNGAGEPYGEALAAFLATLFQRTRGRALVLFTSYDMLRVCARALEAPLRRNGITLLVQGNGMSRDRLTRTFRQDLGSVLLGTDSFWEGVDVIGESLSCVVIARLPFDALSDPLLRARAERVAEQGGDPFRHFTLPSAIIRFRQGFGRLIRHRNDRGWVLVADRRLFSRSYGVMFRRNLPCSVTQGHSPETLLDAVEAFLEHGDPDAPPAR